MNVIRDSLRLARKDLKVLFKDRGQLVVLFVLPLLFALLVGAPGIAARGLVTVSSEARLLIKTYIVNEDRGPYGAQVGNALQGIQPLRVHRLRTIDEADQRVADGEAAAAIILPADFSTNIEASQQARVQLIKDPAQQVEAQIVAGILNEVLTEFAVRAEIAHGILSVYEKTGVLEAADPELVRAAQAQTMGVIWTAVQEIRQNPAINVQREDRTGELRELPASGVVFAYAMPMFATMFAFFLIGFMAESILRDREAGSFRRLLAAPIQPATVLAGKMLAFIGVVFMQMVVMFGICKVLFAMPIGDSPLGLLALTLALALVTTSLGMLLGSIAQTSKQAGSIGLVLGFVLFFASGSIAPVNITVGGVAEVNYPPEGFMFYVSRLTPNAHAFGGYLKLMLYGADLVDILPNILALLGFATIFFLVAIWRFKFD